MYGVLGCLGIGYEKHSVFCCGEGQEGHGMELLILVQRERDMIEKVISHGSFVLLCMYASHVMINFIR